MNTSLHYIDEKGKIENEYIEAIEKVGRILEAYDHDKKIPVYGFGGVYKDKPNHCFPLNQNEESPECDGIDGALDTYKKAIVNNSKNLFIFLTISFKEYISIICTY